MGTVEGQRWTKSGAGFEDARMDSVGPGGVQRGDGSGSPAGGRSRPPSRGVW